MTTNVERMFETATRQRIRFPFKGNLSIEDLWDLSLKDLDSLFKSLNARLKTEKEESLLGPKEKTSTCLELQCVIIRHIVETRLAEEETRKNMAARQIQKQKILEIIAKKQDAGLEAKSEEDLKKMLEAL